MKNIILIVVVAFFLTACTSLEVVELDSKTGLFPSNIKAKVVTSQKFDLDKRKSLILVPNSDYEKGQIQNIGYFDEVITYDDLETLIVKNNLGDKVPSITDRIGVNNAAKNYKPFIRFRFDTRGTGNKKYAQFILTDPLTLDDIFVAETHMDYLWTGVNDQSNWYPMFNALIMYIKENSKTYN